MTLAIGLHRGRWPCCFTVDDELDATATMDPKGRYVLLSGVVWREKIVRDHPEIAGHMSDVLRIVSKPDHVAPDPMSAARTRYYGQGVGPSLWLLVVVSYEQLPARIVSAFANRKDPRTWSA